MLEKRILDNNNKFDKEQLVDILSHYINFLKTSLNPLYFYEDMINYTEWLKIQFETRNVEDFIIIGSFEDNILVQILVAYKIEIAWKKEIVENTIPYYVVGLMYFKNKAFKYPAKNISELDDILTNHFEKQDFNKGFMTIKASPFIVKNTSGKEISKYLSDIFTKTIYGYRYEYNIEAVLRTQEELDNYKFRAFRRLLPRRIKKPLVLLTFSLKNEFRKF